MTDAAPQQKTNGREVNRLDQQMPLTCLPTPSQQQMMLQKQMQDTVAHMQEMTQAMCLSGQILCPSTDIAERVSAMTQLQGQHFSMEETISYTIQE